MGEQDGMFRILYEDFHFLLVQLYLHNFLKSNMNQR